MVVRDHFCLYSVTCLLLISKIFVVRWFSTVIKGLLHALYHPGLHPHADSKLPRRSLHQAHAGCPSYQWHSCGILNKSRPKIQSHKTCESHRMLFRPDRPIMHIHWRHYNLPDIIFKVIWTQAACSRGGQPTKSGFGRSTRSKSDGGSSDSTFPRTRGLR